MFFAVKWLFFYFSLFCWLTYVPLTEIFPTTMENTVDTKPENVVQKHFQRLICFILKPYYKVFTTLLSNFEH